MSTVYLVILYNYPYRIFTDLGLAIKCYEEYKVKNGQADSTIHEWETDTDKDFNSNIVWDTYCGYHKKGEGNA
jgi:hypothetical protein